MEKTHIIWAFQWLLYCFLHSFLANVYIKERAERYLNLNPARYRLLYNLIAFVHLIILVIFHLRLQTISIFSGNLATDATAIALICAGVTVMVLCIIKYFRQLSGAFKTSHNNTLYTGGLHRFVRHPLYFGTFMFLLGALLYWPLLKNLIVVTIIIAYTLLGILFEEKKLLQEFGRSYAEYQHNVPMIIPRWRTRKKKTNRTLVQ